MHFLGATGCYDYSFNPFRSRDKYGEDHPFFFYGSFPYQPVCRMAMSMGTAYLDVIDDG